MTDDQYGKIGYDAYVDAWGNTFGTSGSNHPLPWEDLSPEIQAVYIQAAKAVRNAE